jgi:hypothetical protein
MPPPIEDAEVISDVEDEEGLSDDLRAYQEQGDPTPSPQPPVEGGEQSASTTADVHEQQTRGVWVTPERSRRSTPYRRSIT